MKNSFRIQLSIALLALLLPFPLTAATPLKVGDKAPDFALTTLDDQTVRLSDLTPKGRTVLIVLRGWPGYQCPLCTRQVQDYIKSASVFKYISSTSGGGGLSLPFSHINMLGWPRRR